MVHRHAHGCPYRLSSPCRPSSHHMQVIITMQAHAACHRHMTDMTAHAGHHHHAGIPYFIASNVGTYQRESIAGIWNQGAYWHQSGAEHSVVRTAIAHVRSCSVLKSTEHYHPPNGLRTALITEDSLSPLYLNINNSFWFQAMVSST